MKEHATVLSGPDKIFARLHHGDQVEPLVVNERNALNSAHTNPTSMPDSLLLSMTPIFQIRHPILMFPSFVRAQGKAYGYKRPRDLMLAAWFTLRPSRELHEWYSRQRGVARPQVIDADDILNDRAAVRHICNETGLDPDAVQYEWELKEEPNPVYAVMLSTINASKGIIPGLAAHGLDFETEKAKWKTEFGEEDSEDLAKFVKDAMADYNYLLSRRTYLTSPDCPQS